MVLTRFFVGVGCNVGMAEVLEEGAIPVGEMLGDVLILDDEGEADEELECKCKALAELANIGTGDEDEDEILPLADTLVTGESNTLPVLSTSLPWRNWELQVCVFTDASTSDGDTLLSLELKYRSLPILLVLGDGSSPLLSTIKSSFPRVLSHKM